MVGNLADSFSCAGEDDDFAFGDAAESGFGVDGRVDVMVEFGDKVDGHGLGGLMSLKNFRDGHVGVD
jgi:hypothetical protein